VWTLSKRDEKQRTSRGRICACLKKTGNQHKSEEKGVRSEG
jgi:hypothetical protein